MPRLIFVLETALSGLRFVLQTEDGVNHRHALFERDLLQGRRSRLAEMLRVRGFALQDHAEGHDRVRYFLASATSRTTIGISKAPGT